MFLLLLSSLLPTILALGINCRGSAFCQYGPSTLSPNIISVFVTLANGSTSICSPAFNCGPINDTDVYAPGAHIVSLPQSEYFLGGICAFTQGNVSESGTSGLVIKRKLVELLQHGCTLCGSVPLAEDNDPEREGVLTVNYVASEVCAGVCPPTHYSGSNSSASNASAFVSAASNDTASNGTATA